MHLHRFDSPADLARAFDREGKALRTAATTSWAGSLRGAEIMAACYHGRSDAVPAAERLLERIATDLDTGRPEWTPAPCGAFPIVPEAIIRHPEAMRRRTVQASDAAPVRIWATIVSSGDIDAADLAARGTAILALAMALTARRPTELWTLNFVRKPGAAREHVLAVRIPTTPLNLAEACFAIAHPAFARGIGYSYMLQQHVSRELHWPNDFDCRRPLDYCRRIARAFDGTDSDLVLPPPHSDGDRQMLRDPVAWINATIASLDTPE